MIAAMDTIPGLRLHGRRARGETLPLVLHLHGGAFTAGSQETATPLAELIAGAGAIVATLDYPLAPQHPFPQAIEAAHAAALWLAKHRARIAGAQAPLYVSGDEAGGNLAAGTALMARDAQRPELAGQILFSPMLDSCLGTYSFRNAEAGPVGCRWADGWHAYLGSPEKAAHPYAAPVNAVRLTGLAPALIVTAEDDLLRDESINYAHRLKAAGVDTTIRVVGGPSRWPDAFAEGPCDGTCLCAACHHVSEFFTATAPS